MLDWSNIYQLSDFMLQEPLVSIIMPSYNRIGMLERALHSVISQNYQNWELLVVDDASTDGTINLLKNFSSIDKRINFFRLETNGGACVARNVGLQAAKGEYVTFLDSDDEYLPKKVELQVQCFMTSSVHNLGVVSCGRIDVRNGSVYNEWVPNLRGDILKDLLLKNRIGAGTPFLMVKSSILKNNNILFDPEMPAGQDWDFLTRVCQHASFDVVSEPLVRVHHHTGERVYNTERAVLAFNKQYEKYKELLLNEVEVHDTFVLKMAVQSYVYGYHTRALELLSSNIVNRSTKVKIWQNYMKICSGKRTLFNKATFKALKRATSL
jgi:glycosyltransferase involved in cell wall biosynthesis